MARCEQNHTMSFLHLEKDKKAFLGLLCCETSVGGLSSFVSHIWLLWHLSTRTVKLRSAIELVHAHSGCDDAGKDAPNVYPQSMWII